MNNIEELEGELAQVQKERYDTERALNKLQARLDNMGKDMATADNAMMKSKQKVSSLKNESGVSRQNEELALKVEQLECQIQSVSQEKEQILSDKARIEGEVGKLFFVPRRVRDMIAVPPSMVEEEEGSDGVVAQQQRGQRRKWLRRVILRPWTIFRK